MLAPVRVKPPVFRGVERLGRFRAADPNRTIVSQTYAEYYLMGMFGRMLRGMDPVSSALAVSGNRLLRVKDLAKWYSAPSKEVSRLVRRGTLASVAHGYFLVVPEHRRDGSWRPAIEDLALAIGVADYGPDRCAAVGVSAARLLGAMPRAVSLGTVAAPVHRSALLTVFGEVSFSSRDAGRLDVQRVSTELVTGYCTTVEQTIIDLAYRPAIGGVSDSTVNDILRSLLQRCNLSRLESLAGRQRRTRTIHRLLDKMPVS